jgi:hypothetical protein
MLVLEPQCICLVHLPECVYDPLVLRECLLATVVEPHLLHVTLHDSLDLPPPVSNLVGSLYDARAGEVDPLLHLEPLSLSEVVDCHEELCYFVIRPL